MLLVLVNLLQPTSVFAEVTDFLMIVQVEEREDSGKIIPMKIRILFPEPRSVHNEKKFCSTDERFSSFGWLCC